MSGFDVVRGMAKNSLPSAIQFGKDMAAPFMAPVETAKSLGNLALGTGQLLIPGEQGSEKYPRAVGQFLGERYGGMEEIKRTLATDPFGAAADLSTVLTGGAGLAARGPGVAAKLAAGMSKFGETNKRAPRDNWDVDPTGTDIEAAGLGRIRPGRDDMEPPTLTDVVSARSA